MGSKRRASPTRDLDPACPACGNRGLPEFLHPGGVALCPRCGSFLRRSGAGLVPVGTSTESLSRLVHERMRGDDLALERIQDFIRERVAKRLGIEKSAVRLNAVFVDDLGADSLDVVEIVMALEQEFGVGIDRD